jgi:hypothetical protein
MYPYVQGNSGGENARKPTNKGKIKRRQMVSKMEIYRVRMYMFIA